MNLTAKTKPVVLAAAAALVFSVALAPRLFDAGMLYKGDVAMAKENTTKDVKTAKVIKKKHKTAGTADSDFDSDTDSNATN